MSAREQTADLLARLRRHYIKPGDAFPGGVFVPECGINGNGRQSRADALYVGFTSASGRVLVGHEIKVSRPDWRRELDKAGKADFWADNCHEWWIVAAGPDVVPVAEVPAQWGLMYPGRGTRMEIAKRAAHWPDRQPAWDAVRSILARLDTLRVQEQAATRAELEEKIRAELKQRAAQRQQDRERGELPADVRRRLDTLDRLENLLGSRVGLWLDDHDHIDPATAVAALRVAETATAITEPSRAARYAQDHLRRAADSLLAGLDDFTGALADLQQLTTERSA
ncbi:hypothetical protein QWY28_17505 [Nocardioides sp. SOB77]|uniref:MmcB family DNA repair protein n=1 Tax=Nocardioides oceani TaxID=3058369 RepID=A0ABT8FKV1_9ACTN|nr:hypothetical protein [Nocardioides oceani]MDN4174762.1 hypothetical protein [Nocardioides oceani]